jgi:phytoene dehydrogenase-like protein
LAIEGHVPWTTEDARRAGTLHLGGSSVEIAASEAATVRGEMPDRPFVLAGQQYHADPSRSVRSANPLWAYAHMPHGFTGDATAHVVRQIERFAPGFREQILTTTTTRSAPEMGSSSTPPGGGVHGMCGFNAAETALREL